MEKRLTFGITKIGDLLLKNRISRIDNGDTCEHVLLTIPEYQRPYKWTAKNANQLLDDIEEAMNANKEVYRVGTLILHDKDLFTGHDPIFDCGPANVEAQIFTHLSFNPPMPLS